MRIRTIKPEFFEDEGLARMSPYARLLFIGLWMMADKNGVLEDRPTLIRARLFPYGAGETTGKHPGNTQVLPGCSPDTSQIHSGEDLDITRMLSGLVSGTYLERFQVDSRCFLWIPGFCRHQRITGKEAESELRCPLPPQELLEKHGWGNNGETTGKHLGVSRGNTRETSGKQRGNTRNVSGSSPGAQEGKGKGKEGERKGMDVHANAREPDRVIVEENPFADPSDTPPPHPRPRGPREDDPGMPDELWRMGIQGRQWVRSLVAAGAKIGPNNWPTWWAILTGLYGATVDETKHQALVDVVVDRMVRQRIEAWPDEARRMVQAAQAEEREKAKPGKRHYTMDDTDGVVA